MMNVLVLTEFYPRLPRRLFRCDLSAEKLIDLADEKGAAYWQTVGAMQRGHILRTGGACGRWST